MTYTKCFCFITFCLLLEACAIDNPTPVKGVPTINNIGDNPNIYIAGETKRSAVTWENGSADTLSFHAVAQSVFVDGNDIYVAGWEGEFPNNTIATYWKNGNPIHLSDGTTSTYAKSIFVLEGDVYVTGFEDGSKIMARCWKNGVLMPISSPGTIHSIAVSSFVSGSDVYIVGWVFDLSSTTVAAYWKNGNLVRLTDGTSDCMAESIFVSGDDVYVAGTINFPLSRSLPTEIFTAGTQGIATYWKNGKPITLSTSGRAQSIFVNGNDVYVSGSVESANGVAGTPLGSTLVDLAIYWKNSVAVNLENEASSNASSIVVTKNGDVYTAGWIDHQAVYWRNEMPTHFPIPFQDQGFLYSIFLTN